MANEAVQPIPAGRSGVLPQLVVDPCADAIEFYKKAFNAEELERVPAPDGNRIMHAEVSIGGTVVYLCDDFPEFNGGKSRTPQALGGTPVSLSQYVEDVDAAIQQAADAGAKVTMPAMDMFWGDRFGMIEDPFGHIWSLATHIADPTPEECAAGAAAAFSGECCPENA